MTTRERESVGAAGGLLAGLAILVAGGVGCRSAGLPEYSATYREGPIPLRAPGPPKPEAADSDRYEDTVDGHRLFQMYCSYCHNARPLTERPFSNYQNVLAHMRTRANLTGEEYDKLLEWLKQMQDVPPTNPEVGPSPKRMIFAQPVDEPREPKPEPREEPPPPPPAN